MLRALRLSALALTAFACGGGAGTDPNNNGNNNGNNSGSAKVLTASINGVPFTATTVSGAYLNGSVTINGSSSGLKNLSINALNVTGPGTITLGIGNPWSALGMVIDGNAGQFSSGYGGTGSVTFTTARLGRVTGTFTFTAYTSAGTGLGKPVVTVLNGVFDISSP